VRRARHRLKGHGTGLLVIGLLTAILGMMTYAVLVTYAWR
jgi:hypothetical protein